MDFSDIEITSKKVHGDDVDFSAIEITSKKYAEIAWKFVEIWSSTYRHNINVESTWTRRGVPLGLAHKFRTRSGFKKYVFLTKEPSVLKNITSSFEGENVQTQYDLEYRIHIRLYFHYYNSQ